MRTTTLFTFLLFYQFCIGQNNPFHNYVFLEPPSYNSYLLQSGKNTVLISQEDAMNTSHIWTSFDSSLALVTRKKLITPNAEGIINQSYYETATGIVRVDQFLTGESLQVSVYCFDDEGNITHQQLLTRSNEYIAIGEEKKIAPFFPLFSKDRRIVLLQQAKASNEQLVISTIQITSNLGSVNKKAFSVSFDPEFQYVPVPALDDDGTFIFSVVDKFTSYRLGSTIESYILEVGQLQPSKKEFKLPKKKIKEPLFETVDGKLSLTAFITDGDEKDVVVGLLHGLFDHKKDRWLNLNEHLYDNDVKKALKGIYGQPGSPKMILNNLSVLPKGSDPGQQYNYAILLPEGFNNKIENIRGSSARVPLINTTSIQDRMAAVNSLIGLQPAGFSRPISTFGQAQTYAATNPDILRPDLRNINNNYSYPNSYNIRNNREEWNMPKNLLYFALDSTKKIRAYKFSKMRPTSDHGYTFTAYSSDSSGYYCIYYNSKGLRRPYLNKVNIDRNGTLTEQNLFNQHDKIFDNRYPFIIRNNRLIAFYHYKETGDIGIISIAL